MKHLSLFSAFVTLTLATLNLGCTADDIDNEASENKESVRIIEYGLPDDRSSRAIHDQLPPNQRISSLTYLLYDYNGKLLKEREIPDINEKTVWPLQRATMTWEQREALKDTLKSNRSYHVAFVANTSVGSSGWSVSPLKNKEDFNQAYLELPADQTFKDNNFFYLSIHEINAEELQVNRETPYNCPVVLQRMVSRMDFWCEKMPEWKNENQKDIKKYLEPRFLALYTQLLNGEHPFLKKNCQNSALQLVSDLENYYTQKKNDTDKSNTDLLQRYEKILNNLSTLKTELNANTASVETALRNKEATPIIEQLWTDCLNDNLKTAWTQSWQNAKALRLVYEGTSGADRLKLADRTSSCSRSMSALLPMDLSVTTSEDGVNQTFVGFNWIGFGHDAQKIINIQGFNDTQNLETPSITLTPTSLLQTPTQLNKRLVVYYIPVHSLACKESNEVKETVLSCDPYQLLALELLEGEQLTLMTQALRDALMDNSLLATYNYKEETRTDLNLPEGQQEITVKLIDLPLSIPDLTKRLEIHSNWEVTEQK